LTCRGIGVASAEQFNGRRGHEIRTSGRQNGTGFPGNVWSFGLGKDFLGFSQRIRMNCLASNPTSDALLPKLLPGELREKEVYA
jgi:hypothetical protein